MVFIDVGEAVGSEFERNAVEGAVCELDGKWFFEPGGTVDGFDAVEYGMVFVVIVGDVEPGAGGCAEECGGLQEEDQVCGPAGSHGFAGGGVQWVMPKMIFFRKRRLTCRRVRPP